MYKLENNWEGRRENTKESKSKFEVCSWKIKEEEKQKWQKEAENERNKIEFRVKRNIFGKIFYMRSQSLKVFDSLYIVDYDCLSLRWWLQNLGRHLSGKDFKDDDEDLIFTLLFLLF